MLPIKRIITNPSSRQAFRQFHSSRRLFQETSTPANTSGGIVGRLTRLGETLLYWGRVGVEIVRSTANQQRMSPLDLPGQWNEARQGLSGFFSSFINGKWRDVTTRQTLTLAGRGVEILGFFTVGTMIGKRSIVGYKHVPHQKVAAHH